MAKIKIEEMLIDKSDLFIQSGQTGWWTHSAGLKGRLESIQAMLEVAEMMGCYVQDLKIEASRLYVPSMPRVR